MRSRETALSEQAEASGRLVIVGAGGCGREVAQIAADMNSAGTAEWRIAGFLNDDPDALQGTQTELPILGGIADWQPREGDWHVMALGNPQARAAIAGKLTARGARFASVIHPTARIAPSARLGCGVVIYAFSFVSVDTVLGDHVQLNLHDAVGHDARVGDHSVLSSFCDITGHVTLGARVLLGSHVSIAPGLTVGDDALVGIGSVVVAPVRAGRHVFGNPARALRL